MPAWARYDPGPPPAEGWPTWQHAERELDERAEHTLELSAEQWAEMWVVADGDGGDACASDDHLAHEPGTPGQHWPVLPSGMSSPQEHLHDDPEQVEDYWGQWQSEWGAE